MKVYISGKIGEEVLSEATRQKFAKAESILRTLGHGVFNPTRSGLGELAEDAVRKYAASGRRTKWYNQILIMDIEVLEQCDAIYMLPDWKDSPGAMVEHEFAIATGKKVFYARFQDAELALWKRWCGIDNNGRQSLSIAHKKAKKYTQEHITEVWIPMEKTT